MVAVEEAVVEEAVVEEVEVESGAPPPLVDERRIWNHQTSGARRHSWRRGQVVAARNTHNACFSIFLIINRIR